MRWFSGWSRRGQAPIRRPRPKYFFEPAKEVEDDVPPRGCAWFDSSHELMRGLLVVDVAVTEAAEVVWSIDVAHSQALRLTPALSAETSWSD